MSHWYSTSWQCTYQSVCSITPAATPHTPQEEQPFLLLQSDMIPLMILPKTKKSTHVHTSTLTNMRTLDEDLSVMSPCTQGDCTDQQREVRRWSYWCLFHSSWQRQNAKLWIATVFSLQEEKKLMGKKKKKKEGGYRANRAIPPHTLTSFTSAGIAKPFLLPRKWWTRCVPQWDLCFSASAALTLFQHLRQFKHEQPSFLPACTNTRPLSLSPSLPPALTLSASITLSLTNTH